MATGTSKTKPVPPAAAVTTSAASSSSAGAGAASAAPSVFIPPSDPSIGTWLSLGSYEEVFNSDWDYWAVNKDLNRGGMKLVKILRIHNHHLKDRFDEEQSLVGKGRDSGFNLNVQYLYHGTSENLERICHEGLDERLSTNGHFGRGIYFSDNPAFCRIHSEEKSSLNPFIVRCRVILGDCKMYPSGSSDPALTREPAKTTVSGKNVYYDSVEGKPGDFKQYVVYEKRRALIQFVIYYTADGPPPALPPIPPTVSKSTKKKRPKSKERKRSTSSHNSDSRRRSGSSSGDEKGSRRSGSASSLNRYRSGKSSDADSLDDGDACCSKVAADKSEKIDVVSQPPPTDTVSEVPKVHAMRARTRRLLNSDSGSGSVAISSDAGSIGADTASLPNMATSTGAGVASIPSATTSAGDGLASLPSPTTSAGAGLDSLAGADPNTDAYKKRVQENAMRQMLDLKGRLSKREMDELWRCFSQTYGGANSLNAQEHLLSDKETLLSTGDVDIQVLTDVLVEQFINVVGPIDRDLARDYVTQFDMDVERAVNAYYESM